MIIESDFILRVSHFCEKRIKATKEVIFAIILYCILFNECVQMYAQFYRFSCHVTCDRY